uniref:Uncharacterized protein n=1 Tax=Lotharella globosa TaxID=91324 RepID=A0A7S3Z8J5_9EUKA|mmetsp:Transcript_20710/g.41812  ORF Transcript_20710/g.41812 Transcript_20710/m.41812 type:complete len:296 (+) Transcript_20710:74-961(+)
MSVPLSVRVQRVIRRHRSRRRWDSCPPRLGVDEATRTSEETKENVIVHRRTSPEILRFDKRQLHRLRIESMRAPATSEAASNAHNKAPATDSATVTTTRPTHLKALTYPMIPRSSDVLTIDSSALDSGDAAVQIRGRSPIVKSTMIAQNPTSLHDVRYVRQVSESEGYIYLRNMAATVANIDDLDRVSADNNDDEDYHRGRHRQRKSEGRRERRATSPSPPCGRRMSEKSKRRRRKVKRRRKKSRSRVRSSPLNSLTPLHQARSKSFAHNVVLHVLKKSEDPCPLSLCVPRTCSV